MDKDLLKNVILCRCPNCQEGKIYSKYLTLKEKCSACGWNMSELSIGDAASWLTILLVGHLCVPFIYMQIHYEWDIWLTAIISPLVLVVACLLTLPLAKSFFVTMSYKAEKEKDA